MRGKENIKEITGGTLGITPACAGKSTPPQSDPAAGWDHPRMCGEKLEAAQLNVGRQGSPPHVRGKVEVDGQQFGKLGITPACAGKSGPGHGGPGG